MKIAFHSNQLSELGTEVALYNYADWNERLLGNRSIILVPKASNNTNLDKFSKRFEVVQYSDAVCREKELIKNKVDFFYAIKHGKSDGVISNYSPSLIHCVFEAREPHGNVYAAISKTVANTTVDEIPIVPHMIDFQRVEGDLRGTFGIPQNSLVVGRYGGYGSFDIDFVYDAVFKVLCKRKDVFFLFANTPNFLRKFGIWSHPRVIFLPSLYSLKDKSMFVNTCDAMLHARRRGETFGLAIGEFASHNKLIITWSGSSEREHIDILGKFACLYSDRNELDGVLLNLTRLQCRVPDNPYFDKFNPLTVMERFRQVFLS